MTDRLTVYECWDKARQEFPESPEKRKMRFVELMRQAGHVEPGRPEPLPCGWLPKRPIEGTDQ